MAKWKRFYDRDTKETWYESSDGKGRILQETAGDNRWWNIQYGSAGNREYVRDDNGVAFSYRSANDAKRNFEADVADYKNSIVTRGTGSTSTSGT